VRRVAKRDSGTKPDDDIKPDSSIKPDDEVTPDSEPQNVGADGYPLGWAGPLFATVVDWDNMQLRLLGEKFAQQAHILADELGSYGADAEQLLLPPEERRTDRPWNIEIPPMFADVLQALLFALPRAGERRGPRSRWSLPKVLAMIEKGMTVRAAAKAEGARTRVDWKTIDRQTRDWRARHRRRDAE
jgi:hypothetical protein